MHWSIVGRVTTGVFRFACCVTLPVTVPVMVIVLPARSSTGPPVSMAPPLSTCVVMLPLTVKLSVVLPVGPAERVTAPFPPEVMPDTLSGPEVETLIAPLPAFVIASTVSAPVLLIVMSLVAPLVPAEISGVCVVSEMAPPA